MDGSRDRAKRGTSLAWPSNIFFWGGREGGSIHPCTYVGTARLSARLSRCIGSHTHFMRIWLRFPRVMCVLPCSYGVFRRPPLILHTVYRPGIQVCTAHNVAHPPLVIFSPFSIQQFNEEFYMKYSILLPATVASLSTRRAEMRI